MPSVRLASLAALIALALPALAEPPSPERAVSAVLDDWHAAAAAAQEERYFAHFTPDAVFLGTDPGERWTRDQFRAFAKPFFARGKAWSFKSTSRHVSFSADGATAWFDEMLDTPNMGPCRGSGVLVRQGTAWKIAQYNLSIPIPNPLTAEIKARIAEHNAAKRP